MRIVPGLNSWRLMRTSSDGATAEELPQMAVAAMRWFLKPAQGVTAKVELLPTGADPEGEPGAPEEWRIGLARPIHVLWVSRERKALPAGESLGGRDPSQWGAHELPVVATLKANAADPWYVGIEFWWRGAEVLDLPYPALAVSSWGHRSRDMQGADWLLDGAVAPAETPEDPGDETWGDRALSITGKATKRALREAGRVVLFGGGSLALLAAGVGLTYLLLRERK